MMSVGDQEKEGAEFLQAATQMYQGLRRWRAKHPEASIDEIATQITLRRRELMGRLMAQLACQYGDGAEVIEGVACPDCGEMMTYKGKRGRVVEHLEGTTALQRAYYHCAQCEVGLFPPG
jgi:hypothetical protein